MKFILFLLTLSILPSYSADELISICNRTAAVRDAILEQIELIRLNQHDYSIPTCESINSNELKKVEIIQIKDRLTSLSKEDFKGLYLVKYIDLGDAVQMTEIPKGIFKGLRFLKQIYIGSSEGSISNAAIIDFQKRARLNRVIVKSDAVSQTESDQTDFSSIEMIKEHVREYLISHYGLPLELKLFGVLNDRQEARMIRQVLELRNAYRDSVYDFYKANVVYEQVPGAERVVYESELGLVTVRLSDSKLVSRKEIEASVVNDYGLNNGGRWYTSNAIDSEDIQKTIEHDLHSLEYIESKFQKILKKFEELLAQGKVSGFDESLLDQMRISQTEIFLELQKVLNFLVRWRRINNDNVFQFKSSTNLVLAWSKLIIETYSQWYVSLVLDDKKLVIALNKKIQEGQIKIGLKSSPEIQEGLFEYIAGFVFSSEVSRFIDGITIQNVKDQRLDSTNAVLKQHSLSRSAYLKEVVSRKFSKEDYFPAYTTSMDISHWFKVPRLSEPKKSIGN